MELVELAEDDYEFHHFIFRKVCFCFCLTCLWDEVSPLLTAQFERVWQRKVAPGAHNSLLTARLDCWGKKHGAYRENRSEDTLNIWVWETCEEPEEALCSRNQTNHELKAEGHFDWRFCTSSCYSWTINPHLDMDVVLTHLHDTAKKTFHLMIKWFNFLPRTTTFSSKVTFHINNDPNSKTPLCSFNLKVTPEEWSFGL